MNILVVGATGYLASHITRQLIQDGHMVSSCVRNIRLSKLMFPQAKHIACDFTKDDKVSAWLPRLQNIDVVINAVGIFYHPNSECIWQIHYNTPKALFDAAIQQNVKKIIHISALGVDHANVAYAQSKLAADEYLMSLEIPSVILRPSLVYGNGSYGGSSLFRGLAGIPFLTPVPGGGNQLLQPIHVNDLAKAVTNLASEKSKDKDLFPAVGPQQISLKDFLQLLRTWLCFPKSKIFPIPLWLIYIVSLFGNLIPNSVTNTTAYKMLLQDNISDEIRTKTFENKIGFTPLDVQNGLFSETSTVQDRWHAKLYFMQPLLRFSLAFMWIMSAITSAFLFPISESYNLLTAIGIPQSAQSYFLYGACLINFLIGIGLLFNVAIKKLCFIQILIVLIYTLIITIKLPYLWLEPFGPIVKNIPILVAILVTYALEDNK